MIKTIRIDDDTWAIVLPNGRDIEYFPDGDGTFQVFVPDSQNVSGEYVEMSREEFKKYIRENA